MRRRIFFQFTHCMWWFYILHYTISSCSMCISNQNFFRFHRLGVFFSSLLLHFLLSTASSGSYIYTLSFGLIMVAFSLIRSHRCFAARYFIEFILWFVLFISVVVLQHRQHSTSVVCIQSTTTSSTSLPTVSFSYISLFLKYSSLRLRLDWKWNIFRWAPSSSVSVCVCVCLRWQTYYSSGINCQLQFLSIQRSK